MKVYTTIIAVILSVTLTQCSSSKKTKSQTEKVYKNPTDITIAETYFEKSKAEQDVIIIYFPQVTNKNNYALDKVYFKNRIAPIINGKASFFAVLKPIKKDIILSNKEHAEYGNTLPKAFPYTLKNNECLVTYTVNGEKKYYKVENIIEK